MMKKIHVLLVLIYIAVSWTTLSASEFKITYQNEANIYEQPALEMTYYSDFSKGAFRCSLITGGGYSTSRFNQHEYDLKIDKYYGFVGLMWDAYSATGFSAYQDIMPPVKGRSSNEEFLYGVVLFPLVFIKQVRPYMKMRAGYAGFEVEDSEFSFLPHEFMTLDMILGTEIGFPRLPLLNPKIVINLDAGYSLKQSSIILPLTFTIGAGFVF